MEWVYNDQGEKCGIKFANSVVPLDPANRHYQEIMRLVDAGELTISEPE